MRVSEVDQGSERRRPARPAGASKQDQAALLHDHLCEHRRNAQILQLRDLGRDVVHNQRDLVSLLENVDAESSGVWHRDCDIHFRRVLEFRDLLFIQEPIRDFLCQAWGQRLFVQQPEDSFNLDGRGCAGSQIDIRTVVADHDLQIVSEFHGCRIEIARLPRACNIYAETAGQGQSSRAAPVGR